MRDFCEPLPIAHDLPGPVSTGAGQPAEPIPTHLFPPPVSEVERAELAGYADLLHLLQHRNKNQHRRALWWRHFSQFRRDVRSFATTFPLSRVADNADGADSVVRTSADSQPQHGRTARRRLRQRQARRDTARLGPARPTVGAGADVEDPPARARERATATAAAKTQEHGQAMAQTPTTPVSAAAARMQRLVLNRRAARAATSENMDRMRALWAVWVHDRVERWFLAFSSLTANLRFAPLGLILLCVLARVCSLLNVTSALDTVGQKAALNWSVQYERGRVSLGTATAAVVAAAAAAGAAGTAAAPDSHRQVDALKRLHLLGGRILNDAAIIDSSDFLANLIGMPDGPGLDGDGSDATDELMSGPGLGRAASDVDLGEVVAREGAGEGSATAVESARPQLPPMGKPTKLAKKNTNAGKVTKAKSITGRRKKKTKDREDLDDIFSVL